MLNLPFNNVILIDGSSLLHRSYHSHFYLKSKDGTPTGAVYGSLEMIYGYIRRFSPLQVVVALDTVRTSFRNELYPDYKGTRSERDPELQSQFLLLKEFCEAANIPCLDEDTYEADDLIGTAAQLAVEKGYHPFIVSGDQDLFQLITDKIKVLYLSKNGLELVDTLEFGNRYGGLTPDQMIELKGLQGDSGDNIPGVKGVGGKTAIKLIQEFGNLDTVYENIESQKGKLKERLEGDKDNAYLSRTLGKIKTDIEMDFLDSKIYNLNSSEVQQFLSRLDIKTIA